MRSRFRLFTITFLVNLAFITLLRLRVGASEATAPVVGVFSQPYNNTDDVFYIAASYVKWLEAGGSRSVAIPYDAGADLLDDLFGQINALLLPGGASEMSPAVDYMLSKALQSNQNGRYFPVWGTCLGFEFLVSFVGGESVLQHGFEAENMSLPLLEVRHSPGSLYANDEIYKIVTTHNTTMNNHEQGITPHRFQSNIRLTSVWDTTSTNVDGNGRPFVSTIEPRNPLSFPFYGTQYHPEKNAFEYAFYPDTNIPYEAIDHSDEGVHFSNFLSRYFVALARINQETNGRHVYDQPDRFPLISTTYPTKTGVSFEQVFLIPPASVWVTAVKDYQESPSLRGNRATSLVP